MNGLINVRGHKFIQRGPIRYLAREHKVTNVLSKLVTLYSIHDLTSLFSILVLIDGLRQRLLTSMR